MNETAAEELQTSDIDILFDQIMTDYGQVCRIVLKVRSQFCLRRRILVIYRN
ncbi:hypothetical protein [Siminovitchia fortis]|uniref:hypothetical protein n=1 Tax=Siminovitchia fortis TaxID=254758 RepID=UPI001642C247|nr:hypothetical protein [Siminovitchia fortis]WHY80422.1 hypothetical protein QNH23_10720 [Siminovitchia fortis]